ncbi:MAG: hypothetical protein KDJ37_16635 [Hyphomicrobiaceae bacterium]|nr:hypothetical protein [Hyphomicrobiaceae bacterium]
MRLKSMIAALAVLAAIVLALPQAAEAGGFHRHHAPSGWGKTRTVRHWIYYPRYHHVTYRHAGTDPYSYRYEPRRYYPAYNTHYWVPARCYRKCRKHYRLPPYQASWGRPSKRHYHRHHHHRHYHHRHHRHGGRICRIRH